VILDFFVAVVPLGRWYMVSEEAKENERSERAKVVCVKG
jgi:hypothetical protein